MKLRKAKKILKKRDKLNYRPITLLKAEMRVKKTEKRKEE